MADSWRNATKGYLNPLIHFYNDTSAVMQSTLLYRVSNEIGWSRRSRRVFCNDHKLCAEKGEYFPNSEQLDNNLEEEEALI